MTKRILMSGGRIIVSKAGFDASATLADENKVLDSEWGFTGTLLASGRYVDTAPALVNPYSGQAQPGYTTTTTSRTVVIPLPFTPREVFILVQPVPKPVTGVRRRNPATAEWTSSTGAVTTKDYAQVDRSEAGRDLDNQWVMKTNWAYSGGTLTVYRKSVRYYNTSDEWVPAYERGDFIYRALSV